MSDRRAGRAARRSGSGEALIDDVLWYGLWQVVGLSLPLLWLIYQTPRTVAVRTAALPALVALPATVGLGRHGLVPTTGPWPYLDDVALGTDEGFAVYLARAVTYWGVLGVAAYGGLAVGLATGSPVGSAVIGGAVAVVGGGSVPSLSASAAGGRAARVGLAAVALVLVGVLAQPFATGVGDPTAAVPYLLLVAGVVVDAWPLLARDRDDESPRADGSDDDG